MSQSNSKVRPEPTTDQTELSVEQLEERVAPSTIGSATGGAGAGKIKFNE